MGTRKTDADIDSEDKALDLDRALADAGVRCVRVAPGFRPGRLAVTFHDLSPCEAEALVGLLIRLSGPPTEADGL